MARTAVIRVLMLSKACAVTVSGLTAENAHYRMELDEAGQIVSLFDKKAQREVFAAPGNAFTAYEDLPYQYDNWEIYLNEVCL